MIVSRKMLCLAYGLIALLALIGTWGNNIAYLNRGFGEIYAVFVQETLVNPASRSVTVDLQSTMNVATAASSPGRTRRSCCGNPAQATTN